MEISSANLNGLYQGTTSTHDPKDNPGNAAAKCDMRIRGLGVGK